MKKKRPNIITYLAHTFLFPLFIFGYIIRFYDKSVVKFFPKKDLEPNWKVNKKEEL